MSEPRRLRDSDPSPLERALLEAAAADRPTPGARARMAAALGRHLGFDASDFDAPGDAATNSAGPAEASGTALALWTPLELLVMVAISALAVLGDIGDIPAPTRLAPTGISAERAVTSTEHRSVPMDPVEKSSRAPRRTMPDLGPPEPGTPAPALPSSSLDGTVTGAADPPHATRSAPNARSPGATGGSSLPGTSGSVSVVGPGAGADRLESSVHPRRAEAAAVAESPEPEWPSTSDDPAPTGSGIGDVLEPAPSLAPSLRGATTIPDVPREIPDEVTLLDHIRTAHRAGEHRRALVLITSYDRFHPRGQLRQEVEVLRIEVRLARGEREQAIQLARRFLSRYPSSPHFARVQALLQRSR